MKKITSISMMVTPAFFAGITLKTPYAVLLALGIAIGQTQAALITAFSFVVLPLLLGIQLDPLTILVF